MKDDTKKAPLLKEDEFVLKEELDEVVGGVKYYTIQKGDLLSDIAKKYNTTVSQICSWNNISNSEIFVIGKRIRVS